MQNGNPTSNFCASTPRDREVPDAFPLPNCYKMNNYRNITSAPLAQWVGYLLVHPMSLGSNPTCLFFVLFKLFILLWLGSVLVLVFYFNITTNVKFLVTL